MMRLLIVSCSTLMLSGLKLNHPGAGTLNSDHGQTNQTMARSFLQSLQSVVLQGHAVISLKPLEAQATVIRSGLFTFSGPLIATAFALVLLGMKYKGVAGKAISLVGCMLGLGVTWMGHGFLQEAIMTRKYDSLAFPSVAFLVCANRLVAVAAAVIAVKVVQKKQLFVREANNALRMASLLPAFSSTVTSWLQYASLLYVTFPTQMIFKAIKNIPMMLFGKVMLKKQYPIMDYVEAFLMSAAVATFIWFAEVQLLASKTGSLAIGISMLFGFLLFDSITPGLQRRAFAHTEMDAFQMMFHLSALSFFYSLILLLASGQASASLLFLLAHPEALLDVALISCFLAIGQVFIYVGVKEHGSIVLSMVMSGRQAGSLLLSCVAFGHHLPGVAVVAAVVVFSLLFWRALRSHQPVEAAPQDTRTASFGAETESTTASTRSGADSRGSSVLMVYHK